MEKNIRNLRIGDVLKEYGYINEAQVEAALAYQKTHQNVRMGGALVELGYITELRQPGDRGAGFSGRG